MNRDVIERSLCQPGPLEQAYQPVALPTDAADARRGRGWQGTLRAVGQVGMLAGAIVAGAAIAVMLTRSPAPRSNGVGAAVTPSAAASSVATTPVACTAEDFAWSTDQWGGAAGSRGTTVLARGVTSLTGCEIRGSAALVLTNASDHALLTAQSAVSAISVQAGTLLEMGISWSNWCDADPAAPLSLSLTLPGDTQKVPVVAPSGVIAVPPCLGPGQPSVLNATDFQLSSRTPPEG
ncbi:MAG: hypothetical protein ACXWWU_07725 [Candidatus Limnocylindria bacterium]